MDGIKHSLLAFLFEGIVHCEDYALSESVIRVRKDLAVEVKPDRLLSQRG